jgi:DNA mismatch endonuclease (patch repair protein)
MGLTRSQQMARIKGHDTSPEMRLRKALWSAGLRFRLRKAGLSVRPDLVLGSHPEIAVFIDGCFWHGCPEHYVPPRSAIDFWSRKLGTNVERDRRQTLMLEAEGWTVLRFWECEVVESLGRCVAGVKRALRGRIESCSNPQWRVVRIEWLDVDRNLERRWLQDLRDPAIKIPMERPRLTTKARLPKSRRLPTGRGRASVREHGEHSR